MFYVPKSEYFVSITLRKCFVLTGISNLPFAFTPPVGSPQFFRQLLLRAGRWIHFSYMARMLTNRPPPDRQNIVREFGVVRFKVLSSDVFSGFVYAAAAAVDVVVGVVAGRSHFRRRHHQRRSRRAGRWWLFASTKGRKPLTFVNENANRNRTRG